MCAPLKGVAFMVGMYVCVYVCAVLCTDAHLLGLHYLLQTATGYTCISCWVCTVFEQYVATGCAR